MGCCVITGSICLFLGAFIGMLVTALLIASADTEGTEQEVKQDADR